jgi:TolB-like protein
VGGALSTPGEKCRAAVLKFISPHKKRDREWLAHELADSVARKLKAFLDLEYCDPRTIPSFEDDRAMIRGGRMDKEQVVSLARRIKADLVVVGSYSCDGDTIRADIQAMRPSTGAVSALLRFERPADRICSLEEEMAVSVAELLGRRLSERERVRLADRPTRSAVAFEELCRGRQAPEGSYGKIRHLQKAIAADPDCVEARYLLGNAYCGIGATYRYSEWFNMAIEEYGKAAAVAPDCAKIHCAMGAACMMSGRYDRARKSLERALEIDPDTRSAKGYLLRLEAMGY